MSEKSDKDDLLAAGAGYFARMASERDWSETGVNTASPPGPDPERFAAVNVHPAAREAYRLAAQAVAVIVTGGKVKYIRLGNVNFSTDDESADTPSVIRHRTAHADQPYVWFAGLRASAMWLCWYEGDDIDTATEAAWYDHMGGPSLEGIADKYESRFDELVERFGSTAYERAWEGEWDEELERLDLAVCELASMLIDGQPVTHEDVQAAVDRCLGV
jgi:hypothetical protein